MIVNGRAFVPAEQLDDFSVPVNLTCAATCFGFLQLATWRRWSEHCGCVPTERSRLRTPRASFWKNAAAARGALRAAFGRAAIGDHPVDLRLNDFPDVRNTLEQLLHV